MSKTFVGGLTKRALMMIAAGLLMLSYLAVFINPAKAWFLTPVGLLFFPLALLNLFLLVWAIIRKSKAFIIPFIGLLPTVFLLNRYFVIGAGSDQEAEVTVVSYNVGRFHSLQGPSGRADRNACADSIYNFLKKSDADIICLQEFSVPTSSTCREVLSRRFPGYEVEYYLYSSGRRNFGNVILSKLPIREKGVLKFDRSSNLAVYADVVLGNGTVRVYNCHFESYNISFSGIVKSVRLKSETIIRETEEKMKRSLSLRPQQVNQVMKHIADCQYSTILCGDFNDNPMSYTYQKLIKGHRDTFCEAGSGFGATYSALWPLLRIDYILVPKDFRVKSYRCPRVGFSDHYPVLAGVSAEGDGGE